MVVVPLGCVIGIVTTLQSLTVELNDILPLKTGFPSLSVARSVIVITKLYCLPGKNVDEVILVLVR